MDMDYGDKGQSIGPITLKLHGGMTYYCLPICIIPSPDPESVDGTKLKCPRIDRA